MAANNPDTNRIYEQLPVDGSEPKLLVMSVNECLAGIKPTLKGNYDSCLMLRNRCASTVLKVRIEECSCNSSLRWPRPRKIAGMF